MYSLFSSVLFSEHSHSVAYALAVECTQNVNSAGQRADAHGACATIGQGGYGCLLHRLYNQKVGICQRSVMRQRDVCAVAGQHGVACGDTVAACVGSNIVMAGLLQCCALVAIAVGGAYGIIYVVVVGNGELSALAAGGDKIACVVGVDRIYGRGLHVEQHHRSVSHFVAP